MNYYQHHIGDFDRATRHLTRIERSVYRDLLDVYYDTESPLTDDSTALQRKIIARTNEEVTAVEQVLNEFFIKTPAGWYHDRCEAEIDKFRASSSQKSSAGKASAAKKAAKRQQAINGNSTPVEHTLNGASTDGQLTTNQEPLTTIHKPKKEKAAPSALPDWVPVSQWDGYMEMRKAIKKVPTDRAVELLIMSLDKMRADGQDIGAVLDKSVANNWTDVYPIKPDWAADRRTSATSTKPEKFDPTAYVNRNRISQ